MSAKQKKYCDLNLFLLRNAALVTAVTMCHAAKGDAQEYSQNNTNQFLQITGPDVQKLGWTPGISPNAIESQIADANAERTGYLYIPGVSRGVDQLHDGFEDLYNKTGLQFGVAYTMLFQGLSGGPFPRYGGAGDFDFMTSWTLVGRQTENTGKLVFDVEDRFAIGDRTPNSLGAGIGTLQPVANTFNDRGWVVRDLFWEQRLINGQFRFIFGRGDLNDYFGSTWMQSANFSFVNRMFASNPAVAAPGHGPVIGVNYTPTGKDVYFSAGVANAYAMTTTTGINTLVDNWTFFSACEAGWTPTFESMGEGRYTASFWHTGERVNSGLPEDWGGTVVADQEIYKKVEVFGRYGYSESGTSNLHHFLQGGVGVPGLLGQPTDMAGLAFSYAWPRNSDFSQEKVLEGFYRLQLTRFLQLSLGAQAIFDPGRSTSNEDVVGAFWGRIRIVF